MMRMVEGRTDQIVHPGIHNHELFFTVGLAVKHARQQQTRFRHDRSAGLDQNFKIVAGQRWHIAWI